MDEAIRLNPQDTRSYVSRAGFYEAIGKTKNLSGTFRRPRNSDTSNNLYCSQRQSYTGWCLEPNGKESFGGFDTTNECRNMLPLPNQTPDTISY